MFRILEIFWLALFIVAWTVFGLFATETSTKLFWPGCWVLTIVSIGGIISLHRGLIGRLNPWCLVAGGVLTVYFVLRGFFSEVRWLARPDIVFCLGGFIVWSMVAGRFERPKQRMAILVTLLVLAALNVAAGLWQRWGPYPDWTLLGQFDFQRIFGLKDPYVITRADGHAATGLFWNHNHYSGFLAMMAFPALALAVFGRLRPVPRFLCWMSFILSVAGLATSGSRTAVFAAAAGLLVFIVLCLFVRWSRRRRAARLPVFALAGIMIICSAAAFAGFQVLKSRFPDGAIMKNLNGRDAFWELAFEVWTENPVFGAGARAFEYEERARRTMERRWMSWTTSDMDVGFAHNDILQVLSDYGLAGLLAVGFLVLSHSSNALKFLQRDTRAAPGESFFGDNRGAVVLGSLAGLGGFSVLCLADFNLHVGFNVLAASALFGILANPGAAAFRTQAADEVEDEGIHPGFRTRFPRMALAGVSAVSALWLTWNSLRSWAAGDWHAWIGQRISEQQQSDDFEVLQAGSMEAIRLLQRAAEADPENPNAWFWQGFNYTALADLSERKEQTAQQRSYDERAVDYYVEALRRYPQLHTAAGYAAFSEFRRMRIRQAYKFIRTALRWSPSNRVIQGFAGQIYFAARHYDQALVYFNSLMHRESGEMLRAWYSQSRATTEARLKDQQAGRLRAPMALE